MTTVSEFNFDRQTGKAYVEYDNGVEVSKDLTQAVTGVLNPSTGVVSLSTDSKNILSNSGIGGALTYNRPPENSDNSLKGYTSSSVWQYHGAIYQPASTPDATSAAWKQSQQKGTLPVDVLGANAICAGGTTALKAGFTGPAISLTAMVSSSPVVTDINILAGGSLDNDSVRKVFASADNGTQVYVTKVYDQTGNARHLNYTPIAGKVTRGLYLIWDVLLNQYVLASDQNYGTDGQALSFDAAMSVQETSMSAFFFGRGVGSQANPNNQVVASFGSTTNALSLHTGEGATGPTIAAWNSTSRKPSSPSQCTPLVCNPCVVSFIGGATSVSMNVNEDSYTVNSSLSTARTGGLLGNWDLSSGKFAAMRYVGFVIANTNATSSQRNNVHQWFYTKFNTFPQTRDRVILISDSRGTVVNTSTCNTTGQSAANIGVQLAERLKSDCMVVNCSTSGYTNALHNTNSVPGIAAIYRQNAKNIAVVLVGVNDFLVSNFTANQSLVALNDNISTLKAAGYYTIVITELRTSSTQNNANSRTDELHTLLENGGCLANEVVNVQDLTPATNPLATAFYPDGLHPTDALSGVVADKVARSVDRSLSFVI